MNAERMQRVATNVGSRADRSLGTRLLLSGTAASVAAVPLSVLTALVASCSDTLHTVDTAISRAGQGCVRQRPGLARALRAISVAGHPNVLRVATGGLIVLMRRRGARRRAAWLAATMTVGSALGPVLKEIVARARPVFQDPVMTAPGYSFPSGHALNSMVFAGCLVLLGHGPTRGHPGRRVALLVGATSGVLVIGADRVGLGVHYSSDVVAGWLIGVGTIAVTTLGFEGRRRRIGLRPSDPSTGLDPDRSV
jgi:undecaprenyl-diphosphatase